MSNFKNTQRYVITNTKATIPASANITGTISSIGIYVTGVGTLFKTQMQRGDWITDINHNEIRRVDSVVNDLACILEEAFTTPISALTIPNTITNQKLDIKQLSYSINGGLTDGLIDGVALVAGSGETFGKTGNNVRDKFGFVDPVIADATGTIINVDILR